MTVLKRWPGGLRKFPSAAFVVAGVKTSSGDPSLLSEADFFIVRVLWLALCRQAAFFAARMLIAAAVYD